MRKINIFLLLLFIVFNYSVVKASHQFYVITTDGTVVLQNASVVSAWGAGLPFTENVSSVVHNGQIYICTATHTAASGDEPGVGASWATKWKYAGGTYVASEMTIEDAGDFFPEHTPEAALQKLAAEKAPKDSPVFINDMTIPPLSQTLNAAGFNSAGVDGQRGLTLYQNTIERDMTGKVGLIWQPTDVGWYKNGAVLWFDDIQRISTLPVPSSLNILNWANFTYNGAPVLDDAGVGSVNTVRSSAYTDAADEAIRVWAAATFSGGGGTGTGRVVLTAAPASNVPCVADGYYDGDIYLCINGYYTWSTPLTAYTNVYTPPSGATLNAGNAYAANLQWASVFEEGTGTVANDISVNNDDATVTATAWGPNGIVLDADGELVSLPIPTIATTGSLMMVFTSTAQSGAGPTSTLSRFFDTSPVGDEFQLLRSSDTIAQFNPSGANMTVPDLWNQVKRIVVFTWDDTNNIKKIYVDGVLRATSTSSFALNITSTELILGNRGDGLRPGMYSLELAALWSGLLELADVESLYANYHQFVTDYPAGR